MAKMYHPDIASGIQVLKSKTSHHDFQIDESAVLSIQDKMHRFRIMSEAYELLGDSRKKVHTTASALAGAMLLQRAQVLHMLPPRLPPMGTTTTATTSTGTQEPGKTFTI